MKRYRPIPIHHGLFKHRHPKAVVPCIYHLLGILQPCKIRLHGYRLRLLHALFLNKPVVSFLGFLVSDFELVVFLGIVLLVLPFGCVVPDEVLDELGHDLHLAFAFGYPGIDFGSVGKEGDYLFRVLEHLLLVDHHLVVGLDESAFYLLFRQKRRLAPFLSPRVLLVALVDGL